MELNAYSHFATDALITDPFPFPSEKVMESYIEEHEKILSFKDITVSSVEGSQILWEREERKGIVDLLVSYSNGFYAVAELKKGDLDKDAFEQLDSYFERVPEQIESASGEVLKPKKWCGVLVGTGASQDFFMEYKNKTLQNKYPFGIIIMKRFKSGTQTFVISDTYSPSFNAKDLTKYRFNGVLYHKYELLPAILNEYIRQKSSVTFSAINELVSDFKYYIPVIKPLDSVMKMKEENIAKGGKGSVSYLIDEKYLLNLEDGKYAVIWGVTRDEIKDVKAIAKKLNFEIIDVEPKK